MAKDSNFRSASSGRFVTASKAAKSPGTTLKEPRTAGGSSGEHYRSAGTGRYVTTKHGKASVRVSPTKSRETPPALQVALYALPPTAPGTRHGGFRLTVTIAGAVRQPAATSGVEAQQLRPASRHAALSGLDPAHPCWKRAIIGAKPRSAWALSPAAYRKLQTVQLF